MVDSRLAFDIVARGGSTAAAELEKVARATDKTGDAMKKNSKISDELAKRSDALAKAHNAETNALDKVQVAEQRLAEVRSNSKAKTSQVLAAEKALAKARREAALAGNDAQKAAKDLSAALDEEGKKAGKGLGSGLKKWFTGDGKSVFESIGKDGGTVFGSGLAGALKTPVLGPALIAGVGGAVAVAAPIAGSIAASGLVAGFGAGIGALGIVFAAKSEAVQAEWSRTLRGMGADMKVLSAPFEKTLISMASSARRAFATFKPELAASFKTLAPAFTQFGDDATRALERLAPALRPLSVATSAVLKSLGGALPGIVGNLSTKLIELADSVSKNPDGLKDLASGLGSIADSGVKAVTVLNDVDRLLGKIPGGFSNFAKIPGMLNPIKGGIDTITGGVGQLDSLLHGGTTPSVADLGKAATLTGGAAGDMAAKVAAVHAAAGRAAPAVTDVANATAIANRNARELAATFDRQAAATQRASDALAGIMGSQVNYAQALADANAAIKENGKTHDLLTQKGRDNQRQLLALRDAANQETKALQANGDGNVAAAKHGETARQSFVKLAQQMGYTGPQARAMAKTMVAIPNVTRTAKLQANKADLEAKLASAKKQLADPKLTATKKAKLQAEISNLQAGIQRAKAALASVPASKTTTITTVYKTVGSRSSGSGSGGGHINETRASGGPVVKGRPYWVGEKGPEPFIPDQNGTILPNSAVKKSGSIPVSGMSIASGMAAGIRGGTGEAISAASDMANAVIAKTNQVLGISSPSKKFTQIALYIAQGFNRGIRGSTTSIQSAMSSLMSKVVGIGYSSAKQGRILRMLQMENKALQAATIARAKVATALKAAQAKLAAAIQVRNEFRQQITEAALSFNAITSIQPGDGKTLIGRDILESMQNTLAKTKAFATNLANLKKLGLRSDLYKQIAEAGVEAGGATAQALLQGGKGTIAAANNLQAQIANASAGLGNTAANNMYKAGVDAAQGLVNGLLAKTKALNNAAAKLANQIVAQIRKTLGIHSPSRVLKWHGSMAALGFKQGIEGEYGLIAKAASGMGDAARQVGAGRTAGSRVAPSYRAPAEQRIIWEVRSSGRQMDNLIAEIIRRYVHVSAGGDVQQAFGRPR
ncbi:hypothetical protein AB0L70_10075 [Kribbella sp. NPDC051952]|uniref:hypothetical protein n=1 Tax=Kribbella sp. NPDC051952 TaxID=3154851 RepID=UPI00341B7182